MTHIEKIRAACIKANPERFKVPADLPLPVKYDGMVYYWGKNGEMVADFDAGANTGEGFRIRGWGRIKDEERQDECARYIERAINGYNTVRLADVLLAVEKAGKPGIAVLSHGEFISWNGDSCPDATVKAQGVSWNLHEDNLDHQSEETLSFIASLL